MRNLRLLILLCLSAIPQAFLQAQTPIKGIINTYHKVQDIVYGKSCVVVVNATGLAPGDKVMLVQMKGAGIYTSSSGNNDFGDTTSLYDAGNYELGTICTVSGDSVFLLNTIIRSYTLTGKVQLVGIPVYENAVVVDSLKAKAWNNAEGKGGVLALSVTYSLFLNAPVSATGAGYWGGTPKLSSGDCNDYIYPSGQYYNANNTQPQSGAFKGESVWELTSPQYSGGKGAVANGGGGGNNHNNGGGGGANLSPGGMGGGNNSATTCTRSNPGEGGKALRSWTRTKIFMGGGGGAGHVNTGYILEGGGNGGGLVYIHAQSLISSGNIISANGQKGGNAIGDGASGGGAGGTILMDVAVYSDAVKLEARGGDGGQEDDEFINYKCYGEGGGGSGGVVYLSSTLTAGTLSVAGGSKGAKINSMSNCDPAVPGSAGAIGVTGTGYSPIQSTTLSPSCTFVLPATLLYFKASVAQDDVVARWQIGEPGEVKEFVVERRQDGGVWKEVARVAASQGMDTYSATDKSLQPGSYLYRLKIIVQSGAPLYSSQQRVSVSKGAGLAVYPNPAKDILYILLPEDSDKELKVYDLSGRLLLQKRMSGNGPLVKQDVSTLKEGLYILRIGVHYKVFRIQ